MLLQLFSERRCIYHGACADHQAVCSVQWDRRVQNARSPNFVRTAVAACTIILLQYTVSVLFPLVKLFLKVIFDTFVYFVRLVCDLLASNDCQKRIAVWTPGEVACEYVLRIGPHKERCTVSVELLTWTASIYDVNSRLKPA